MEELMGRLGVVLLGVVVAGIGILRPEVVQAQDKLQYKLRLGVIEEYQDNYDLRETAPEDDYVTEVNPGIQLDYKGARLRMNADYRFRGVYYSKHPAQNQTYHILNGSATAEILRDRVFLDVMDRYFQTVKDPQEAAIFNNIIDVNVFSVSPRLELHPSSRTSMNAFYRYTNTAYRDPDIQDSLEHRAGLSGEVGLGKRISLGVTYEYDQTDYDVSRDYQQNRVAGVLGYALTPETRLTASYGYAWIDFEGTGTHQGPVWSVGLDRALDLSARTRLKANYVHEFTNATTTLSPLRQPAETLETLEALGTEAAYPLLNNRVYESDRVEIEIAYQMPKTSLSVGGFYERADYVLSDLGDVDYYGVNGNVSWQVAPKTRLSASGRYRRTKYQTGERSDGDWYVQAEALNRISRWLTASLRYRLWARESNVADASYRFNAAALMLNATF